MFRLALIAAFAAAPAFAHDHWSDLDGDGFLEADEYDIGEVTFADADQDGDGLVSAAEYEAIALIIAADDNAAVLEDAVVGANPTLAGSNPGPKIIAVD
ncbi:hypothetical protein ACK8OR_05230 [Jannaschia sp. KMU-145]|uniref:hypothetical protein n=1 Tax=Jannaschia halovivens TaxID=3388667 RepID=UPI00396B0884